MNLIICETSDFIALNNLLNVVRNVDVLDLKSTNYWVFFCDKLCKRITDWLHAVIWPWI